VSARTIRRSAGIEKILDLVTSGKVDNLVIHRIERPAHNIKEAVEIVELVQKKGVALHYISEHQDAGSASGRLFYNILSAMSQWDKEREMEDSQESRVSKRSTREDIRPPGQDPVTEVLLKMLENQEPACTCRLLSELLSLAEEEQAADRVEQRISRSPATAEKEEQGQ